MGEYERKLHFHQIPLVPLRKKFGSLSEMEIAAKIMEEVNTLQEIKFELKSTTFNTTTGYSTDGKIQGFQPLYYSRMVKILHPLAAEYHVFEYVLREQRIIFHCRANYLFVITFLNSFEQMQPYSCKQFPQFVFNFGGISIVNGWKMIPSSSTLYNLQAFKNVLSRDVRIKIGDGFVKLKVDEKFDMYGIPEMLNFLIEVCKLGNGEEND